MKIMVVGVSGTIEIINLVGTIEVHEPGSELEFPRNQSPLHVVETGMDYFFREDGCYDGWGMAVSIPVADMPHEGLPEEARAFIQAIEDDREFTGGTDGTA